MPNQHPEVDSTEVADPYEQIKLLHKVHEATITMAGVTELPALRQTIVSLAQKLGRYGRVLLLVPDEDEVGLKLGHISEALENAGRLDNAYINTYNMEHDPVVSAWINSTPFLVRNHGSSVESSVVRFMEIAGIQHFYSVPLVAEHRLIGALILELHDGQKVAPAEQHLLKIFAESSAVILQNALLHHRTVEKLDSNMHEMTIIQQIDRELNETIELSTVFNMTLDWALRFTNASAATIALYEEDTDTLRTMRNYGYSLSDEQLETLRDRSDNTISHRVARSGRVEIVPDVILDSYTWAPPGVKSQMAVPVMREDRVIAVITLESRKIDAFTDSHISFVQKLANRAGVAVDNARLYSETELERQKLSYILATIADIVIVIGRDDRIVIISQSAISALDLYPDRDYKHQLFVEAVNFTPLKEMYLRADQTKEGLDEELTLPNGRVYYTKIMPQQGIGYVIVMQDITPFKEMDRLKSELIATVSHDLKQPLGVMRGYLELLQMIQTFEGKSQDFIKMIDKSITGMRHLIDDLLDLARIESGVDLKFEPVPLKSLLLECIEANASAALVKNMTIQHDLPAVSPIVLGEKSRLMQIFNNLISNAIKYTPPEGKVRISVEQRDSDIRVSIHDNGLGISPEDLPHIFERFYRVRRSETEGIDGTGLGLAIVKKLVEAHRGKIRVESKLGEGSVFYVTLPAYRRS
ncbi:MAG: hypothetical protein OHK0046_04910 [Anaerolineae bacterium]